MKQITLISFLLICVIFSWGQTDYFEYKNRKGDSIKIKINNSPTVCDCINVDWRNKKQKKVCTTTYDYDFMSEEEQVNYIKQKNICLNPSICDCANASNKDKGLLKACNSNFNYKNISKSQLQRNIKELEKCPETKTKEIAICDCINVDDYKLKKKCNETFFNDSLISENQRMENINAMKKCIENKNYSLDVTACDCALNSETDSEFKKICDEKIEKLKANKRELTDYLYTQKVCTETKVLDLYLSNKKTPKSDYKYTVCRCNENDLEKEASEKCNQIWNYKNMNTSEKEAFTNAVERCN